MLAVSYNNAESYIYREQPKKIQPNTSPNQTESRRKVNNGYDLKWQ